MTHSIVNTASALVELAQRQPDVPALIEPHGTHRPGPYRERRLTYRELDALSDRYARGLARRGLGRGTRAALMVPPSIEMYALTFALFKLGAIVVLIDPGMGVKNLGRCLGEAEPEAFLGVARAHVARVVLGWAKATIRYRVMVGRCPWWGAWSLRRVEREGLNGDPVLAPTRADETAAILFTSGSTGIAKGAVYTHGIFAAQVRLLRAMYGIAPGEIDLPTFPLFGLFGPALGMTAVLPEMDATRPAHVDPRRILHAVQHYHVSNLFGSPALLRRVAFSTEAKGVTLPTLRRVISAGAPVPAAVLAQTAMLLPEGVQVHTPYGATEALPVATIGSAEVLAETASETALGKGVCVGRPIEGMSVRILRIGDDPLPTWDDKFLAAPGEIGEIAVSGPVVTRAYYNRPEATAQHKIVDPTGALWHRMGDVGYFDDRGRLWFCGRKSQRVVTPQGTLFTIPCEGVFNAVPGVARTALVGLPGGEPALCVEAEPGASPATLLTALRARGQQFEHTRPIRRFLFYPAFPVDVRHNAKIFREKLAVWAATQPRGADG